MHCGSQGSPCGTGVSLACPDGPCALPAAPPSAPTAVRAVLSALGQAHWSPPQAGATAGRQPTVRGVSHYIACAQVGPILSLGGPPNPRGWVPRLHFPWAPFLPPPPFAVWFVVVGFPSLLGGLGWWWWGGGSSPLLAELLVCVSPPLLADARRRWRQVVPRHSSLRVLGVAPCHSCLGSSGVGGGVGLRHSWLRSAGLWGVVPRCRLRVLGGRSLATPG